MNSIEAIQEEARLANTQLLEQMVQDQELKDIIANVHALRLSNNDPNVVGTTVEEYEDSEGLAAALRLAGDFRTGPNGEYRERWEAEEDAARYLAGMSSDTVGAIMNVASRRGLTESTSHSNPRKDAEIILGGGGRSPLERSVYTAREIRRGLLFTDRIIGLGSARQPDAAELVRAGDYAFGAESEEDLLRLAIAHAFDLDPENYTVDEKVVDTLHPDVPNVQRIGTLAARGLDIKIVSAAVITDPYRSNGKLRNRATTTDALTTVVKEGMLEPGDEAGIVTNSHFQFQGAEARKILGGHGVRAETIYFGPLEFGHQQKQPHELLMELLTLVERTK